MRLVLDTNVWLDWLVFDDAAIRPLRDAFVAGKLEIAIDPPCLEELRRVLRYPAFGLEAARQEALLAQVRSGTLPIESGRAVKLPLCSDPDDQKFLELARNAGADWLISKDKALHRLGSARLLAAGFRVGTPQQWAAAEGAATANR